MLVSLLSAACSLGRAERDPTFTEVAVLDFATWSGSSSPGLEVSVDTATSLEGGASLRVVSAPQSAGGDEAVRSVLLAVFPEAVLSHPSSLVLEVSLLVAQLDGTASVSITRSGNFPVSVGETKPRGYRTAEWDTRKIVTFLEQSEKNAALFVFLEVIGSGTVWVDRGRLLSGPAWQGAEGWEQAEQALAAGDVGTAVPRIRRIMAGDDLDQKANLLSELARIGPDHLPDEVQQELIELYLQRHRAVFRAPSNPLEALLSQLYFDKRFPLFLELVRLPWQVHEYHQIDYLERLLLQAPEAALARTYGRELIPFLMKHSNTMLDEPLTRRHVDRYGDSSSAYLAPGVPDPYWARRLDHGFIDCVEELLRMKAEDALELTDEELNLFRLQLGQHWRRLSKRERSVGVRYHNLIRALYWLGFEEVRDNLVGLGRQRLTTRADRSEQLMELELIAMLSPGDAVQFVKPCYEQEDVSLVKDYLGQLLAATESVGTLPTPPDGMLGATHKVKPYQL